MKEKRNHGRKSESVRKREGRRKLYSSRYVLDDRRGERGGGEKERGDVARKIARQ